MTKQVFNLQQGGSHAQGLERRKGFLLQLGLARHEAYELAKCTNFDVDRYEEKCQRWLSKGYPQEDVFNDILCDIRNENKWNDNVTYGEEIPYKTESLKNYQESNMLEEESRIFDLPGNHQYRFQQYDSSRIDHAEYYDNPSRSRFSAHGEEIPATAKSLKNYEESNMFEEDDRRYNLLENHQSPFRHYDSSRIDHDKFTHNPSRSRSPSKRFDSIEEKHREEYGEDINYKRFHSRPYSPIRREELSCTSRFSRSPKRNLNASVHTESRNEDYFPQHEKFHEKPRNDTFRKRSRSFSPTRHDREIIQRYHTSHSRSPERSYQARKFLNESYDDLVTIDSESIRNRTVSLAKSDYKEDSYLRSREQRYRSARSRSPIRSEGFLLNRDYSSNVVKKENPRSISPSRNAGRKDGFQTSRSRSPNRRNFLQHDKYEETLHARSRSRAYSPPKNNLRDERNYQSSRSRSPYKTNESSRRYFSEDYRSDVNDSNIPRKQMSTSNNKKIPSLLDLDVFSKQSQTSNEHSHNSNIPSLLSLKIDPEQIGLHSSSSTSSLRGNHYNKFHKKQNQKDYKKPSISQHKGNFPEDQRNSNANKDLKQHIANIPVIQCGLQKPPPGHLKANPQEYWSQWWPKYKYIEYSLPKIDVNDNEIKNCINFLFRPREADSRRRKQLLLKKGVNAILKTVDINERNYYLRDIFKIFQYKQHLEDPSFQNSLTPEELNCIAPALRQFQIKSTMAYLHQALIVKWHVSLDIMRKVNAGERLMSNYARLLLNEKSFHYLVKESIQELKQMCHKDWPQFYDFYKKLKASKFDIYTLGVGPNLNMNSNRDNYIYRNEEDHNYDNY